MKTFMKVLLCSLVLMITCQVVHAQSTNKELKKDLKSRVEKDCRKTAKALVKEGWKIMPGKLPMERQIQDSRYAELDKDKNGERLYVTATHDAVGGNYSAAKKIADDRAHMELAANISSTLSEMVKGKLSNTNYGEGDIDLIDEFISTNKNLVSVRLQSIFPVLEIYREKDNGAFEVRVMVKVNAADALKAAKRAYHDELYKKSEQLAKELDEILPY